MAINLGNIVSIGGKSVSSGIVSGLDVEALVNDLSSAKEIPKTEFEDEIELNSERTTAFGELRTILDALKTSSDFLRNPPGINNESENIFEYRLASLTSNTSVLASTYLSATASPGASLGDFAIEVDNLAVAYSRSSGSFSSKTTSVTEAASGTTSGLFSAGSFQITPTVNTLIGDKLAAADYTVGGSATGIITAEGIHNFVAPTAGGDNGLQGVISGFSATAKATDLVDITVSINGTTYTASDVDASTSGTDIAAGTTITFSDGSGTSFDIELASAVTIDQGGAGEAANLTAFENNLTSALSTQTIRQTRELGNFVQPLSGDVLNGLERDDAVFRSDAYNTTDGTHGSFGEFTVNAVSAASAADASISVVINGETFQATGLGTAANDTHTANITLTSTTDSDKTLSLNISDASVTLDFSTSTTAQAIEDALDKAFGVEGVSTITLDEGDSLVDIEAKINAVSNQTGVSANIVKISDSDFRFNLESNNEGVANIFSTVDSTGVLSEVSFTTQSAENSQIKIDNITIERTTNSITDAVDGLNLTLLAETPVSTVVTAKVDEDKSTSNAGIVNFINAFNEFRIFAVKQTLRDDEGNLTEEAVLGQNTLLKTLITQVSSEITRAVSGVDNSDFQALANIGITLIDFAGDDETPETSNILTLDPTTLDDALASNFDDLRQIFEFTFNASSSDLTLFSSSNSITLTDFKVDIDTGRTAGNQVRILDTNNNFLFNMDDPVNGSIKGKSGTALDGMTLIYQGDGTDVIDVNQSQGIADRLFNILDPVLEKDGDIDDALSFIVEEDSRLEDEIAKVERTVDRFRSTLLAQFTALESAIARINTLLDFIDVNNKTVFDD